MSYEIEAATRYRAHAAELRAMAEDHQLEKTRVILLRVAYDYDRMAENMEAIEAEHRRQRRLKPA